MSKKHETMIDPSLFYCFVIIWVPTSSFKFYIVPSKVVARYVKAEHEHWLTEKRRERKNVKDSKMFVPYGFQGGKISSDYSID